MVRERQGERLDAWIEATVGGEIAELCHLGLGWCDDHEAIRGGPTLAHSHWQTEGSINTKISTPKLAKRSMYGRGKGDLLRQHLFRAA